MCIIIFIVSVHDVCVCVLWVSAVSVINAMATVQGMTVTTVQGMAVTTVQGMAVTRAGVVAKCVCV